MSNWNPSKQELLQQTVEHIDIKRHNVVPLVEAMKSMAYSARDLARAADILDRMVRDPDCGIIVCLAGSLMSAGLKQVIVDMIHSRMVDAIVSTGANIVDQDFFEALGFRHYIADEQLKSGMYDGMLREHGIDRIYDTLIDEDELRICDETVKQIADRHCPGRLVLTLEGGYDLRALSRSVRACIEVLAGAQPPPLRPQLVRATRALRDVRAAQAPYWRAALG